MDGWMEGRMNGWKEGWKGGRAGGQADKWIHQAPYHANMKQDGPCVDKDHLGGQPPQKDSLA